MHGSLSLVEAATCRLPPLGTSTGEGCEPDSVGQNVYMGSRCGESSAIDDFVSYFPGVLHAVLTEQAA